METAHFSGPVHQAVHSSLDDLLVVAHLNLERKVISKTLRIFVFLDNSKRLVVLAANEVLVVCQNFRYLDIILLDPFVAKVQGHDIKPYFSIYCFFVGPVFSERALVVNQY